MSKALKAFSNSGARRRRYCHHLGGVIALTCVLAGWGGSAAAQMEDKASQYAHLMEEGDTIERYTAERQKQLQSMQDEMASLQGQISGLDGTADQLNGLLQKMYDSLSRFVAADLPFHVEERRESMDRLADLISDEKAAPAEKYRRLMEAYQIELEYGRTMEAYQGTLDDGRDAFFVHLGRVSLMYRTKDGSESGYWDAAKKAWVADNSYARVIAEALNIAQETTAPDIITVPVPAAKEMPL